MSNQVAQTRIRILKAALKRLEAADGDTVRVSDVAKEAGVTRQTLYLYFRTRTELLIAVTHYVDELNASDARLAASRTAPTGLARLEAYIDAWTAYIPEIYPVARALMAMNEEDATAAWQQRMLDMWEGCEAAIKRLKADGQLSPDYGVKDASDLLWTLLSVRNWEHLRIDREWSQRKYVKHMQAIARRLLVAGV
ncbi:TetR/AcrR family transcriptional regulator [Hyphomonas sp.]|uniref:TetR/AcrR family transcriptional regulator n=1 Tax=Hyphomonas sp. TaxID=87 RepID=UPI003F700EEF|tara:strand:- start:136 stop:720 length:585 start_codon:yes stop_codon:yes gene_type:complete